MTITFGLAGIQMNVVSGKSNLDAMAAHLEKIHRDFPWVEMAVFSESCIHGLDRNKAEPIPGPTTAELARLARTYGLWLVPGSLYEPAAEGLYTTSPVIDPDGNLVTRYRKMYPWEPWENLVPGDEFCVFDIPGRFRIGLCICYDQWFPEVIRQLAWMGAEIIINPVMTTTPDRPLELVLTRSHAITNQLYFLSVNGVGAGGNGQSIVVDPEGRVLAEAGETEEAVLTICAEKDRLNKAREWGTLGQCQALKTFRDRGMRFPVYEGSAGAGAFSSLGPLKSIRDFRRNNDNSES